jgi:glycerate dehydrogenase
MRAVILDHATLAPADLTLEPLWQLPIEWQVFDTTVPHETAVRVRDVDIVLTNKVELDAQLLRGNPHIKLIVILATGTNNVDLAVARELGIAVSNVINYSTESVVQHTFALMLTLATKLLQYRADIAAGRWRQSKQFGLLDHPVMELHGKTLGVVGCGTIGRRVADVARAFGMQVLIAQRAVKSNEKTSTQIDAHFDKEARVPLAELLARADIVSLHCPLTADNRHMINDAAIACMKPQALFINVSRGALVDERALADALKAGRIAGAGIDVLSEEPPVKGNPLLEPDVPNIIVTPHSAWASREARQTLVNSVAAIVDAFMQGRRINAVA